MAIPPRRQAAPAAAPGPAASGPAASGPADPAPAAPPNPNANLSVSADGRRAIREREGYRSQYYNDVANNCSYGVGQLAHMGPCTVQELGAPVSAATVNDALNTSTQRFEQVVRQGVPTRGLTQNQFDALTSFVFNVPALAPRVLQRVEAGDDAGATAIMSSAVNIHHHDAHGRVVGGAVRSPGLVTRRRSEVDQYNRR